jgi:hypothetical protein
VLADGSGLFMGVEAAGPGALAARVCIARPGGELALFVCEAPWHGSPEHFAAGGLDWRPGRRVRYSGPAVLYDTHDAFVDLEGGLRSARVVEVEVEVPFARDEKTAVSERGYTRIGERAVEVSPLVVRRGAERFVGEHGVRARVMLTGRDGGLISIEDTASRAGAAGVGTDVRRVPGKISFADDGTRVGVSAEELGVELDGVITVRVPVYRPAPDGGFVKVVFGVVALDTVASAGFGRWALFEVVRKIQKAG